MPKPQQLAGVSPGLYFAAGGGASACLVDGACLILSLITNPPAGPRRSWIVT
jgi:hypothetical protein